MYNANEQNEEDYDGPITITKSGAVFRKAELTGEELFKYGRAVNRESTPKEALNAVTYLEPRTKKIFKEFFILSALYLMVAIPAAIWLFCFYGR